MPRLCTICSHPERAAIEKALVDPAASNRRIAAQHGVNEAALRRHKTEHLPEVMAQGHRLLAAEPTHQTTREPTHPDANRRTVPAHAVELVTDVERRHVATQAHAIDLMEQISRCFERINLLFDACDAWLRDADDPSRYDIGPRAYEITVTYLDHSSEHPRAVKEKLDTLLAKLVEGGVDVQKSETRYADPRKLVLDVASGLKGQMELYADLLEKVRTIREIELFEETVIAAIREAAPDVGARIKSALQSRRPALGPL